MAEFISKYTAEQTDTATGNALREATPEQSGLMSAADKQKLDTNDATSVGGYKIWVGTQAEYDAIVTKDPNTQYNIKEE